MLCGSSGTAVQPLRQGVGRDPMTTLRRNPAEPLVAKALPGKEASA
jgi:hypothetical protein